MTLHAASRSRCGERGFSLIELIVALAILSIMLVALVPLTGAWRRGVPIEAVVNDIVVTLRSSRVAAIYANRATTFTLDSATGQYWSDAAPRPRALPARVVAALGPGQSPLNRIQFFPDGGASGGAIILRDARRSYIIEVEALSGRIKFNVRS